jgi:hypothetical protein
LAGLDRGSVPTPAWQEQQSAIAHPEQAVLTGIVSLFGSLTKEGRRQVMAALEQIEHKSLGPQMAAASTSPEANISA